MERSFDNAVGVGVPLTKLLFFLLKVRKAGNRIQIIKKKPNDTKVSSGHLKVSFGNSLELFAKHPKFLLMKVRKWYKLNKNFEKPFSWNCCSGHTECLFMELSGNLLLKLRTVHNQNTETKEDEYSIPGKKSEKNQDTKNAISKTLIAKFPSKVQKVFVQCWNVMVKDKRCKNNSTKCPLDRYNSILTTLSDFFSTKVQTYSLNDCFEVKKLQVFLKRSYFQPNIPLDNKLQFWQPYWTHCETFQRFFDQSPKTRKTKNKMFEKTFSSSCCSGHKECNFKELYRSFPIKVQTVFEQNTKKRQAQSFRKKNSSKWFLGHMKCNFDKDVRIFPTKNKLVSLKVGKRWKLIQIFF